MNNALASTILLVLLMAACSAAETNSPTSRTSTNSPKGEILDGVSAFVNGDSVTIRDVMEGVPDQLRSLAEDPAMRAKSQQEVFSAAFAASLDECIDRKLVLQEYWAGEQRIPATALVNAVNEFIETRYQGDVSALQRDLAKSRITYDDWKDMLEQQSIVRSMRQTFVGANVHISPNEIAMAYEGKKSEWVQPAKINVLTFALPDDASFDADYAKFKARLAAGEDFSALAKELSVDAMAEAGGDYGLIVPDDVLAPPLAKAVKSLKDGAVSDPIKLGANRYIVLRKSSVPEKTLSLREAQADIERKLYDKESERIFKSWIARLRSNAKIKKFDLP